MTQTRIKTCFEALKAQNRAGLVIYVMAGDPDLETTRALLAGLPEAGADVIELGLPFTDPMADGPSIQAAGQRALKAGMTVAKTLDLVAGFRRSDADTPLITMGYANPLHAYGYERFVQDAADAGVDGALVVDLPPEESAPLAEPLARADLALIRLAAPTTDAERLPAVLQGASGFLYYVSIAGVTGAAAPTPEAVACAVASIRETTDLPVAVGFGVKTPEQAQALAPAADAVVVGSAIVDALAQGGPDQALDAVARLARALNAA
ncbi:MAG: tryptophan synthase subunit alpha [Maricaulaceae bacterium]